MVCLIIPVRVKGMLAVFAEFEGDMIVTRTRDTTEHMKSEGKVLGHPPYGYTRENGTLVRDPEKLRTVRKVYDLYNSGHSQRDIARMLATAGLSREQVRGILTNPIYAGMVAYGRRKAAGDQRTRKNAGAIEPSA